MKTSFIEQAEQWIETRDLVKKQIFLETLATAQHCYLEIAEHHTSQSRIFEARARELDCLRKFIDLPEGKP